MIVRVKYFKDDIGAYTGAEYTYLSDIDVKEMDKVIVPVGESGETKKAVVTKINLPSSVISPAWADRMKKIRGFDR